MAYEALQLPDLTKVNELFNPDLNAIRHGQALSAQITPNILQEQLRGAKLTNDLTEQLQPQQLQLLSGLTGLGGLGISSAAPSPGDTSPPGAAPAGGRSLLSGDTPTSADQAAQQRVAQVAQANGVNPEWAMRVQHAESGTFPNSMAAVSPAGALGTMQLMPGTAKDLGVDPNDPEQNVTGGVKYLAQLKQQYGDPVIATAAYNAGPGKVDAWLAGKAALPSETVNYVGKIFGGNGVDLLHNVFAGAHGHPVAGVQVADASGQIGGGQVPIGPGQSPGQGAAPQGLAPMPMDDRARASVKQLAMMRALAVAKGDYRGAAAFTSQLDNVAGPGGVVDPTSGNVYQVPGSFQTRFNAARAAEAGKVGPAVDLHAQQAAIDQQTHSVNAATDTQQKLNQPVNIRPGGSMVIPSQVMPGVAPSTGGVDPASDLSLSKPPGAAPAQGSGQPGVFQAPVNPSVINQSLYEKDQGELSKVSDEVMNSQASMAKVLEQRRLLDGLPTGAGGEARTKWANVAETYLPPELASRFKAALSLPDAAPAQEYAKLSLQNAGTQERQVLGGRGGYRAIELYKSANPSMELQPTANRDIHNLQLVAMQADQDYGNGQHDWVAQQRQRLVSTGGHEYRPASDFDRAWLQQRNPQVYAAATAAMNGKPFEDWSKGLKPDEATRAMQIISRIDPTTKVKGRSGDLSVTQFAQQAQ